MVLEQALRKATTDKGISYLGLNTELRKAGTSAAQLTATLAAGGENFRASLNAANVALTMADRNVLNLNAKIQEMSRVLVQSFKFTAAQTAIRAVSNQVQEAYHWVTDLHDAVNDIAVVTGKTGDELAKVTQNAVAGAKELKVAAKEYAEGALIFYQQGLSDDEVTRRNEITIKAAKAANQSIQDMSSQLTAIWNTYGMVGEEQERAASVGSAMAAQTAVDFSDIAEAMQTAAAPAAQMGVSYNSLAAIIATVGDTTQQSASVIGNAYKTIFSRFEQLKSSGTDGEVTLGRISEQIQELGFSVLDEAGQLKDLDTVIMEVGSSWETLSKKQQLALAQVVGGTRQYGQFLALMDNFDKYESLLASANAEDGSALEQQYTQAIESIDNQMEQAAEAWNRAFSNLFDTEGLKDLINLVETLGNTMDNVLGSFGGVQNIALVLAGIFAKQLVPKVVNMGAALKDVGKNLTPSKRIDNIEADFRDAGEALQRDRDAGKITLKDFNLQKEKNDYNIEFAKQNERINTELRTATGAYKVQLEQQKQQLAMAQQELQVLLDQKQAIIEQSEQREKSYAREAEIRAANADIRAETENPELIQRRNQAQADLDEAYEMQSGKAGPLTQDDQDYLEDRIARLKATIASYNQEVNNLAGVSAAKMNAAFAKASSGMVKAKGDTKAISQVMLQLGKDVGMTDEDLEEWRKSLEQASDSAEEQQRILVNLQEEIEGIGRAANASAEEMENFGNATSLGDEIRSRGQVPEEQQKENEKPKTDKEIKQNAADGLQGVVEGMAQIAANGAMAAASVKTLFTTISDDSMATSEKLLTVASMLPMAIGGITGLIEGIGTLKQGYGSLTTAIIDYGVKLAVKNGMEASSAVASMTLTGALKLMTTAIWGSVKALAAQTLAFLATPVGMVVAGLAAITAGIIAFIGWKKKQAKAAKEAAEAEQEELDKQYEVKAGLEETTQAIKENIAAWEEAKTAGEGVIETYNNLEDSLIKMSEELELAGFNVEKLNDLMNQGLSTGNFEEYYKELNRLQEEHSKEILSQIGETTKANLEAAKTANEADFSGTGEWLSAIDYSDGGVAKQNEQVQNIIDDLTEFNETGANSFYLDFDYENAEKFMAQYQQLQETKARLENVLGEDAENNTTYQNVIKALEREKTLFEQLTKSGQTASKEIRSVVEDQVKAVSNLVSQNDFASSKAYVEGLVDEITKMGLEAGMTTDQINALIQSILGSTPALNNFMTVASKMGELQQEMAENQGLHYQSFDEISAARQDLQSQKDTAKNKEGSFGRAFNGLNKYQETQLKQIEELTGQNGLYESFNKMDNDEAGKAAEEFIKNYYDSAEAAIEEESRKLQNINTGLTDLFSKLDQEDYELMVHVNAEGISTIDDLEDKIQALSNLELEVKIDPQIQIDEANAVQENLKGAMDEYSEGTLSYETVEELLALGPEYKRFIVETAEGYALSTEAIQAYNESIEKEKEAIDELLSHDTDFSLPFEDLAYAAADLSAMPELYNSEEVEGIAGEISKLTEAFWNGKIAKEEFFSGSEEGGGLLAQLEQLKTTTDNLSGEQFALAAPMIDQMSTSLLSFVDSVQAAYAAGEMDGGDLANNLNYVKEAAEDINDIQMDGIKKQLASTGKDFDSLTKNEDGLIEITEDLTEEQKRLAKAFNDSRKRAIDLGKASKNMDIGEEILGTTSKYYDKLKEVFDEDTLKLNPDVELDFSWMDDMASEIYEGLSGIEGITNEQITTLVNNSVAELSRLGSIPSELQGQIGQVANAMLTTGVSFSEAAAQIGVSTENMTAVHAGAMAAIVQTGNTAVNQGMNSTIETLSAGEAAAAQFAVNIWAEPGPLKSYPVKFKIPFVDKEFGFNLPLPSINLKAEPGNEMALNAFNKAAGIETPTLPSFDDFSGLQASHPELDTPTLGDPEDINTDDQGTKRDDGDGSGSGGGDKEEKEAEKLHERYEDLTEALERQTNQLDKISKASDNAWGAEKVRQLQRYNMQLQRISRTQTALIAETKDYLKQDKEAFLKRPGMSKLAQFDEQGNLTNFEQIRRYLENKSQEITTKFNQSAQSEADKTQFEASQKEIEGTIEALEQLKETEDLLQERISEQIDRIHEWMSNKVEEANYRMEFHIGINEQDIALMDRMIEAWGDLGTKTGKTWDFLHDQFYKNLDSFERTVENSERMHEILTNIAPNSKYQAGFTQMFGEDAWNEYMKTGGRLPAEVMDQLSANIDSLNESIQQGYEYAEQMFGMYMEIFDMYMEDFDRITERIENNTAKLETLSSLLEFSGKKYTEEGMASTERMLEQTVKNAQSQLEVSKAKLELAEQAYAEKSADLQDFTDIHGTNTSSYDEVEAFTYNQLKAASDAAHDALLEAEGEIQDSLQGVIDAASEAIEQMADVIKNKTIDAFGGIFDSVEMMTGALDAQNELDGFFLEDYDRAYQLESLMRDLDKAMADITDPARMQEYLALQKEINEQMADGVEMTQTDMDLLKAKFEVQQAMDAYEEAKNAKNTMRLARDASGNWNYVYSNDSQESEDAAQKLADAQYNYDKLLHEARDEAEEYWMKAWQDFTEYHDNVNWKMYQQDEEYRREIDFMLEFYAKRTEQHTTQLNKYNEMLGAKFSETSLGIIVDTETLDEAQAQYTQNVEQYKNDLIENTNRWEASVEQSCESVGIDYKNLEDTVYSETTKMGQENDALKGKITDLKDSASKDLTAMNQKVSQWREKFISDMQAAINKLNELLALLRQLQNEQAQQMVGFNAQTDYTAVGENAVANMTQEQAKAFFETSTGQQLAQEFVNKVNTMAGEGHSASQQLVNEGKNTTNYYIQQMVAAAGAGSDHDTFDESKVSQDYVSEYGSSSTLSQSDITAIVEDILNNLPKLGTGGPATHGVYELGETGTEYVLNPQDTKNVLAAVQMSRQVVAAQIQAANLTLGSKTTATTAVTTPEKETQPVAQDVKIEASFPGVSVASEIEEAFNNLVNQAVQYASRVQNK